MSSRTRAGFVAVVGLPNAGKSTFLNQMVGRKTAIVTPKKQTTRTQVRGIQTIFGAYAKMDVQGQATQRGTAQVQGQIVWIDTPGLMATPMQRLESTMMAKAWSAVQTCDAVLLLHDVACKRNFESGLEIARSLCAKARSAGTRTAESESVSALGRATRNVRTSEDPDASKPLRAPTQQLRPLFLALNKIDLASRLTLLQVAASFAELHIFREIFMISAKRGSGQERLQRLILHALPESPLLYPAEQKTDLPQSVFLAELTREKLFLRLHEELPYNLDVETTSMRNTGKNGMILKQTIRVAKTSQRAIVLGHRGQTIRSIRESAQTCMQRLLSRPVHLFLHVQVDARWSHHRDIFSS